jgi:hypothetical protein
MLLSILWMCIIGLFCMWLVILGAIGERGRLFLAKHPLVFLAIHVPVMFIFVQIGGEGLLFGVGNLIAGLGAQFMLMAWGVRKHGLTWTGGKTESYQRLHPKVRKTHLRHRLKYGLVSRLAQSSRPEERL